MEKVIIKILESIGGIGAWLFPVPMVKCCTFIRNHIYTGYLRHRFAKMGNSNFVWKVQNLKGERYIYIGDGNVFGSNLQMTAQMTTGNKPVLTIGNNCIFRQGCHITATNSISIGDNLLTGTNVLITDNSHGNSEHDTLLLPPKRRNVVSKGRVVIGNNVWLGNNVCVMSGVTIGDGAIVGANSVVTHDIPAFTVAAGVPAQIIKTNDK